MHLFYAFFFFFISVLLSPSPGRKLGLFCKEDADDGLFESLFATMADTSADFTGVFRELMKVLFLSFFSVSFPSSGAFAWQGDMCLTVNDMNTSR